MYNPEGPHREFHVYLRENTQYAPPREKRNFPLDRGFFHQSSWADFTPEIALQNAVKRAERAIELGAVSVDVCIVHRRCIACEEGFKRDRRGRKTRHTCTCVELGGPTGERFEFTLPWTEKNQ